MIRAHKLRFASVSRVAVFALMSSVGACDEIPESTGKVVFGGERPAVLALPDGVSGGGPLALLVILHSYGSDGAGVLAYSGLGEAAKRRGVLHIAPDGLRDSAGSRFWNGSEACCDFDGSGIDDAAYVVDLVAEIGESWSVDQTRVAVVGFEAGGFLAYQIGCLPSPAPSRIASIGGAGSLQPCMASTALNFVHIHGDRDGLIDYGGTDEHPSAVASATDVAVRNGCDPLPIIRARIDIDATSDGDETRIARFPGCSAGSVELWTRQGSQHRPPLRESFAGALLESLGLAK